MPQRKRPMAVRLEIKIQEKLLALVDQVAHEKGVPRNDVIAPILAEHFARPDLGTVPRGPFGRPKSKQKVAS